MSTTKWSNATVTSEGLSLQAELLNGGGIEFTRVMGADANGDDKIELTMQPTKLGTAKITIPVLLSNIELTEGFTMTQLRFYAKGTGGAPATEILYAVVQDEDGDQIPSASESPGFTADWSYTFQFGNAESMTVSLDPAGLISLSMVGQPNGVAALDANGQVAASQLIAMLQSASVALAYDDESTYEEGDYCTRDGQLYKANADIATAETWDASHWTAVNVMDLIAALTGEDIPTSASDPTSISSQLSNLESALTTPPQEYSLPLAEGIIPAGGYKNSYCKNQFGELSISIGVTGNFPNSTIIFTLPEGFRPTSAVVFSCYSATLSASTSDQAPACITIGPSGVGTLSYAVGTLIGKNIYGCGSFLAGG
ncbi:hypothetical protein [Candidatus Agathobaculum pullicola]|uniref:hypothetical protein n=1 Tax=Candidatus Agathobaculum pullicola TaxID=2838426 RepID=UPI003F8D9FD1